MKVLSIGNSFSEDAHRWLHDIAEADNFSLDTFNLFIGGCSLETHSVNIKNDTPAYDMQGNGGAFIKKCSIKEALQADKYNIVTLQQVTDLREKSKSFNYKNGGRSLCRDGFHLSLDYGRFTAAAVWYKTFTGNSANIKNFVKNHEEFDASLLEEINEFT